MKHWSENEDHLVVYHGTHIKNVPGIIDLNGPGISNKDPKTGMISVAIGSHGRSVGHGYAAMSGERNFRQSGKKAVTVPHEDRAVVVAHLPMDWVRQHVDRNFGGNPPDIKRRLADPEAHDEYVKKNGEDFSPLTTPELRFDAPIEAKYIVGYSQMGVFTQTQREKKMKTFKQFVEESLSEQVPTTSASGGGVKNFDPILDFGKIARRLNLNKIAAALMQRPPKDTFNHDVETHIKLSTIASPGL